MDGIELLLKRNEDERKALIEVIVSGSASDFANYKHICGVIRGLDLADEHIRDLAKRMNDNDDND
jgi:hypothetical protein